MKNLAWAVTGVDVGLDFNNLFKLKNLTFEFHKCEISKILKLIKES